MPYLDSNLSRQCFCLCTKQTVAPSYSLLASARINPGTLRTQTKKSQGHAIIRNCSRVSASQRRMKKYASEKNENGDKEEGKNQPLKF